MDLEEMLAQLAIEEQEFPEQTKRRIEAWRLRIQGYSAGEVAKKQKVSLAMIYKDWEWGKTHLPVAMANAEDFKHVSLERLEQQYRQLSAARNRADDSAHRVSLAILETQAKILGVLSNKVDVSGNLKYEIVGVDLDQV